MSPLLHLGALVPAVLGTAALYAPGSTVPSVERAAALMMLVGMIDVMTVRLIAPIWWFAVFVLGAVVLATVRRYRPIPGPASAEDGAEPGRAPAPSLTVHLAIGLVVTAGLIVLMPRMDVSAALASAPAATAAAHAHVASGAVPIALAVSLVIGQVALACAAVHADRSGRHRVHHLTMAGSTIAMGLIVIL